MFSFANSTKLEQAYPTHATLIAQTNAAGIFNKINLMGGIFATPIIIGLKFRIPYIKRDPKINAESYFLKNPKIRSDFSATLGNFFNKLSP